MEYDPFGWKKMNDRRRLQERWEVANNLRQPRANSSSPRSSSKSSGSKGSAFLLGIIILFGIVVVANRDTPKPAAPDASGSAVDPSGIRQAGEIAGSPAASETARSASSYLRPVDRPEASYPDLARDSGVTGNVLVEVQVLPDGSVGDATARSGSDNTLLIQAALDAARRWRFEAYSPVAGESWRSAKISFTFPPHEE
jgi:TonB family protein